MPDPRYYQILTLSALLLYGLLYLDFPQPLPVLATLLIGAQLFQYGFTRLFRLSHFEPRSALISSLSLCLLLRTESLGTAAAAAGLAIGSKFLLRPGGKHLFNPANFALTVATVVLPSAWISPGQWGNAAYFTFLVACIGMLVIYRSQRVDITLAFLACYAAGLFLRGLWLGDPLTIPAHQSGSGALLIFAFFMISDPKTTPDSRAGRLLFAALVAAGALYGRFVHYEPNALIYALTLCSLTVPLLDRWLPAPRYEWRRNPEPLSSQQPSHL